MEKSVKPPVAVMRAVLSDSSPVKPRLVVETGELTAFFSQGVPCSEKSMGRSGRIDGLHRQGRPVMKKMPAWDRQCGNLSKLVPCCRPWRGNVGI
jgi:hypothetical protein